MIGAIAIILLTTNHPESKLDDFDKDWIIQGLQEERTALKDSLASARDSMKKCIPLGSLR